MEGVGARLGRSSTRYGPATVFSGPVRKWKKRWIHVSPSNNSSGNNNHAHQNLNNSSNGNASSTNGNNGSHLLLYKWAPLSQRDNGGNNNGNSINGGGKDSVKDDTAPDEPPRRKFKYIPVFEDAKFLFFFLCGMFFDYVNLFVRFWEVKLVDGFVVGDVLNCLICDIGF